MMFILFKKLSALYLKLNKYIQGKEKVSVLTNIAGDVLYNILMFLGRILDKQMYLKLDFSAIKKYYNLYGYDETLKKFKLTERILDKIVK